MKSLSGGASILFGRMPPPWSSGSPPRPSRSSPVPPGGYDDFVSTLLLCPWSAFRVLSERRIRCVTSTYPKARTAPHRTPFHGVSCSSTLSEVTSDLHRGFLSRLCCAFRLSQPLDALFRSQPFQSCFIPVTPLSFCLQRFPSTDRQRVSRHRLPLLPSLHRPEDRMVAAPGISAISGSVHIPSVLPVTGWPFLS